MLAGVLLHVIEAALPIDLALHFFALDGSGQHVHNSVAFIDHIHYRYIGDGTGIERLTTRGWLESGAVQIDSKVGRSIYNAGAKFGEIGIGIV
jgi:hypothetical protein